MPEHEREALLGGIEHEAERLVRLVANMLDLSRIEAGVLQPRRTLMPVDELLYAAVDDAAAALDGQVVDIDGAAELPPVSVDETMIRQVLVNLLENASRADPDDALGLYASSDGADARASRSSTTATACPRPSAGASSSPTTGCARPRSARGHRPRARHLRGFVEAHGGHIRVDPTPGGGATFTVELPRRRVKRPMILLVDDEPTVLRALRVALEAQDYAVTAVLSGEDALARITNGAFDLVLLDLGLPGIERVRRHPARARAVPGAPDHRALGPGRGCAQGRGARPRRRRLRRQAVLRARAARARPRRAAPRRVAAGAPPSRARSSAARSGSTWPSTRRPYGGEVVSLTRTQFALLACFMRHPGGS